MNRSLFSLHSIGFVALFTVLASGCGSSFPLMPDASVPFSQGVVEPSFKDNGNGSIVVKVKHLGDPGKIASGAKSYVVWIVPNKENAEPQNVGALKVNSDQEGELNFSTTFRTFSIMITPESAVDVTKPSGNAVLKGNVSG